MIKHLLEVAEFNKTRIDQLIVSAEKMYTLVKKRGGDERLKHKVCVNLFYEASTRTSSSFEASMYRLGGNVISINNVQFSSVAKGETLEDTIRTLEQYADCIVLRHPEIGAAKRAASVASKPIINAGDGAGEHPTQALLDLFTVYKEKGTIDGLNITMVGDLKYGRTVHSLAKILDNYSVKITFVAPQSLEFPTELQATLTNTVAVTTDLEKSLKDTDILYVTRIQKERLEDPSLYESLQQQYVISKSILKKANPHITIMHPLPRINEISIDIDEDPRAAYFRQVSYGLAMRMAIFDDLLLH